MAQAVLTSRRGQALECGRLTLAVLVVFIHARFPGNFGRGIDCLARLAVPFFFAVSGYFSYRVPAGRLLGRLKKTVLLALWANAGYLIFECLLAGSGLSYLRSLSWRSLWELLAFQASPFAGHLWYLNALALCYGVLWLHVRRRPEGYKGLYGLGAVLLAGYCLLEPIGGILGWEIPYLWFRNGLLLGLPMFLLGLRLGERTPKALSRRGPLLVVLGLALSLAQWFLLRPVELPFGMLLAVPALLAILVDHPRLPISEKFTDRFGPLSTALYILHPAVLRLYEVFLQGWFQNRLGAGEPWGMPVAVLMLSLILSALWTWWRAKRLP